MRRTTTLAILSLGFLAAAVVLYIYDHENAGFGCLLASIVLACEIPEKDGE